MNNLILLSEYHVSQFVLRTLQELILQQRKKLLPHESHLPEAKHQDYLMVDQFEKFPQELSGTGNVSLDQCTFAL